MPAFQMPSVAKCTRAELVAKFKGDGYIRKVYKTVDRYIAAYEQAGALIKDETPAEWGEEGY